MAGPHPSCGEKGVRTSLPAQRGAHIASILTQVVGERAIGERGGESGWRGQCFPCGPKPDVVMKPRVIAPVLCTCNEPQKGGFFMKFLLKIIGLLFPNLGIGLPVCLGH